MGTWRRSFFFPLFRYRFDSGIPTMRLFGKYSFETLQRALQGIFAFYQTQDLYILELFTLRAAIKPEEYVELYVLIKQEYTKIGTIQLH